MSYTILYRSMFVKVSSERYIPLYESGSNNCYDVMWNGRMRRERSWSHYYPCGLRGDRKALPFFDARELTSLFEKDLDDAVYCGLTVSGIRCTEKKDLMNYWQRAIKRAKTFEELKAASIDLKVTDVNYGPEAEHYSCNVSNEEELIKAWQECLAKCGNASVKPTTDVSDFWYRQLYPKQPKVVKKHNAGYVVTINSSYISRVTPRKFHYTPYAEYAHVYPQHSTADKLQQRIQRAGYPSTVIPVRKNADGKWEKAA